MLLKIAFHTYMGSSAKWEAKKKLEFRDLLHGAKNIENMGRDYFSFECRSKMILKRGTILCKILNLDFVLLIKIQIQNKYIAIKSLSEVLILFYFSS